jgi:secondary thiamine-phosphate synthase enzyme
MERVTVRTGGKTDFQDITGKVQEIVSASGVSDGVCHVFVPHTTAGITLNEHADPSVADDIAGSLDALVPESGRYRHTEGNSPGHIKSSLVGSSVSVFIENGKLVLGTWQGIFFSEFDGPRTRNVLVKVMADKG